MQSRPLPTTSREAPPPKKKREKEGLLRPCQYPSDLELTLEKKIRALTQRHREVKQPPSLPPSPQPSPPPLSPLQVRAYRVHGQDGGLCRHHDEASNGDPDGVSGLARQEHRHHVRLRRGGEPRRWKQLPR